MHQQANVDENLGRQRRDIKLQLSPDTITGDSDTWLIDKGVFYAHGQRRIHHAKYTMKKIGTT